MNLLMNSTEDPNLEENTKNTHGYQSPRKTLSRFVDLLVVIGPYIDTWGGLGLVSAI